jgi:hypothetical protein
VRNPVGLREGLGEGKAREPLKGSVARRAGKPDLRREVRLLQAGEHAGHRVPQEDRARAQIAGAAGLGDPFLDRAQTERKDQSLQASALRGPAGTILRAG